MMMSLACSIDRLRDMQAAEIGVVLRVPSAGGKVASKVETIPLVEVEYFIQPITRGVLKVSLPHRVCGTSGTFDSVVARMLTPNCVRSPSTSRWRSGGVIESTALVNRFGYGSKTANPSGFTTKNTSWCR